ncbi:MAG: Mini-ribonuclease 3 [Alkaliphilus sp.]|nr:Mini-ribonuclease 3 [Alkaliphilus sp. AH-315-G20]PHS33179.1 MAG: Mini-ribonuclease 3 [Alkaliphilus sp.]
MIEELFITNNAKTEKEVRMMSPLVLAYIGDAVLELYIRSYLVNKKTVSVNVLHKTATNYVKAKAQSMIVHTLKEELSEMEWSYVKKGRNQKTHTVAKNASLQDYRYATGYETLLGYLFLTKKTKRLEELIGKSIKIIENAEKRE